MPSYEPSALPKPALIVFAKAPTPGHVKTRLTPHLSEEEAARLYEAFLRDALAQYQTLDVDVRVFVPQPQRLPEDLLPTEMTLRRQRGEGLGNRMRNAFRETFGDGYTQAVIIGTDHPTLPLEIVRQAFRVLENERTVCIGPSEDGGYYLLGMNEFRPEVFEGMTYSHEGVFDQTLERIQSLNVRLETLPEWYDVDTPEALQRLLEEAETAPHPLPHTLRALHREKGSIL